MKIVIIGMGAVGRTILDSISGNTNTITIIDKNPDKVEKLISKYDVSGVCGNGACLTIQNEANVKGADLVLALTGYDELNILACLVAKKNGAKNTIARISNPAYRMQTVDMKDDLGLSMIVSPEKEAAMEIFSRINLPSVARVEHFANGRVSLVEMVAESGCSLIGNSLITLGKRLKTKVLICAVQRGDDVFIPKGTFVINEGDRLHFTADTKHIRDFLAEANLIKSPLKNIMIIGGTKTALYLADELIQKKFKVKLLVGNKEIANNFAEMLPKSNIINGDGTQHDMLIEEGIESMDAFVALTEIDEENMIASMFANKMNVRKVITGIKGDNLYGILKEIGITNTVSPQVIVANRISDYIHALNNHKGGNVVSLYNLVNNRVEALEFHVNQNESFCNKPLRELRVKPGCSIACVIRRSEVIVPNGNTIIKEGDSVTVVTTHTDFNNLSDIFE